MHISALEEYGIRCALQLAKSHESGALAASRIARLEGLSVEYVSKIMHLFRKSGLVLAARGNQGGFYLAQQPTEISLQAVFDSLDSTRKDKIENFCDQFPGQQSVCTHSGECALRPVWQLLSSYFNQILSALTLQDLMGREIEVHKVVGALACKEISVGC